MKKQLGIMLIVAALVIGYFGIDKLNSSGTSIEVVGIKLDAQDNNAKTRSYVLIGLSVLCFFGGISLIRKI